MRRRLRATLGSLLVGAAIHPGLAAAAGTPVASLRCAATAAPSLRDAASNLSVVRGTTRRAARRDALRRCRAAIAALPLAAGGKIGDALPRDRALGDLVDAALRRARLTAGPRYFADGGVALEYEVRLDGALGQRLSSPEQP